MVRADSSFLKIAELLATSEELKNPVQDEADAQTVKSVVYSRGIPRKNRASVRYSDTDDNDA